MSNDNMGKNIRTPSDKLKIDDDYFIDSDSHQLLLQKRSVVGKGELKGETTFTTISYCGNLESILDSYINIKIRENIKYSKSIPELIELMRELRNEVKKLLEIN